MVEGQQFCLKMHGKHQFTNPLILFNVNPSSLFFYLLKKKTHTLTVTLSYFVCTVSLLVFKETRWSTKMVYIGSWVAAVLISSRAVATRSVHLRWSVSCWPIQTSQVRVLYWFSGLPVMCQWQLFSLRSPSAKCSFMRQCRVSVNKLRSMVPTFLLVYKCHEITFIETCHCIN